MVILDVAGTGKSCVESLGTGHTDVVRTEVLSSLNASELHV